jgi:hypothetical protein
MGRETLIDALVQEAISVLHHDTTENSEVDRYERETLRKRFASVLGRGQTKPPCPDGELCAAVSDECAQGCIERRSANSSAGLKE